MNTQFRAQQPGNKAPKNRCSRGFTLVEIMVVMAIISALALIAYPSLSRFIPNYELKAATRQLHADFQKAKLYAVKKNRDVTFSFTEKIDATADCTGPQDCTGAPTNYSFKDDDGVVVTSNSFDGKGVCVLCSKFTNGSDGFDPKGLPTETTTGSVKLTHLRIQREYVISQSPAGNMRIE